MRELAHSGRPLCEAISGVTIVVTMTLADTLRTQMQSRGVSIRELARLSGVSKSYVDALLAGTRRRVSLDKAEALARALDISVETLTGKPQPHYDTVIDLLQELTRRCESLGMEEVPVRGSVPCQGEPREQTGTTVIPKNMLDGEGGRVFALKCNEAMREERIDAGDDAIVDPGHDVTDVAQLYVLFVDGETVIRRTWRTGACLQVSPPVNGKESIPTADVKVLGRVVLTGRWQRR